jgi:hypothetical protein
MTMVAKVRVTAKSQGHRQSLEEEKGKGGFSWLSAEGMQPC